jgi:uncharacterized protein
MFRRRGMNQTRTVAALLALGGASLGLAACGAPSQTSGSGRQLTTPNQVVLAATNDSAVSSPGSAGTVTTVGTGTVTGAPDTLTIGVGVSTTAPHAATALSQNNDIAGKVQQALAHDGVAAKDIQTTGLSLGQAYPESDGYQAFDEVTATIHDISKAGTIIDDALAPAGDAGRLEMVNFSLSSSDPYMASARQSAVASAKAEAEQLAAAAGAHLGALISITDQQSPTYPQPYGVAARATSGGAAGTAMPAVPVQAGSQQVTVSVTTVWAIAP